MVSVTTSANSVEYSHEYTPPTDALIELAISILQAARDGGKAESEFGFPRFTDDLIGSAMNAKRLPVTHWRALGELCGSMRDFALRQEANIIGAASMLPHPYSDWILEGEPVDRFSEGFDIHVTILKDGKPWKGPKG